MDGILLATALGDPDRFTIEDFVRMARRPEWHARAACRGKAELFFPDDRETAPTLAIVAEAKAICAMCPVALDCAAAGRCEKHGIWAGETERERRQVRRQKPAA